MARTIDFKGVAQADFSDANQAFLLASNALDNAIKSGKQTVKEFNDTVVANNDAVIKEFINSIPKEDWHNRQEDINQFINQISNQSGKMFSRSAVADYKDNRLGVLQKQDEATMTHLEKEQKHQEFDENVQVNKLIASAYNDPTKFNDVRVLAHSISPSVGAKFDKGYTQEQTVRNEMGSKLNDSTAQFGASSIAPVQNAIEDIAIERAELANSLANLTDPNQQAQAKARIAKLDSLLQQYGQTYPNGQDAITGIIRKADTNQRNYIDGRNDKAFAQQVQQGQLNNQTKQTDANITNQEKQTAIDMAELAIKAQENEEKNSKIKVENLLKNPLYKQVASLGYPLENSDDFDFKVRNSFQANIATAVKTKQSELNSLKFTDWLSKNKKDLSKYMTENEGYFWDSRLQNLLQEFNEYPKAKNGRQLTDYEKIELVKLIDSRGYGLKDWLSHSDSPNEFINRALPTISQKYQNELALAGRATASKQLGLLKEAYGVDENQLMQLLLKDKGIGNATALIPEETLKSYTAYQTLINQANSKPTTVKENNNTLSDVIKNNLLRRNQKGWLPPGENKAKKPSSNPEAEMALDLMRIGFIP